MTKIYIDADGCPVKDEVYRVAERYKLPVVLVANKRLNLPLNSLLEMVVVTGAFDAADDWIVENSMPNDIVVTADILLADRCLKKSVRALGPKGVEFTSDNIGSAVAIRELTHELRQSGEMHSGPAPMDKKARSRFLVKLDEIIQTLKRRGAL
jgi:uncharacterized protein YaiI (UPF0178 family)